eukprot:m.31928 g.31928  ORF g.31928 m.31928 type:complete len:716 (+) comp9883_c0_seq1:77-2224(+)
MASIALFAVVLCAMACPCAFEPALGHQPGHQPRHQQPRNHTSSSWDDAVAALKAGNQASFEAAVLPLANATLLSYTATHGSYFDPSATNATVRGWTRDFELQRDPAGGGMRALVFVHAASGRGLVAFRGTDLNTSGPSGQADNCADAQLWSGKAEAQLPAFCKAFPPATLDYLTNAIAVGHAVRAKYPGLDLLFTGHSLGAGLAGLVAAAMPGTYAAAFAPPPLLTTLYARLPQAAPGGGGDDPATGQVFDAAKQQRQHPLPTHSPHSTARSGHAPGFDASRFVFFGNAYDPVFHESLGSDNLFGTACVWGASHAPPENTPAHAFPPPAHAFSPPARALPSRTSPALKSLSSLNSPVRKSLESLASPSLKSPTLPSPSPSTPPSPPAPVTSTEPLACSICFRGHPAFVDTADSVACKLCFVQEHEYKVYFTASIPGPRPACTQLRAPPPFPRPVLRATRGLTPVVDGVLSPGEWTDATWLPLLAPFNATAQFEPVSNATDFDVVQAWVKFDHEALYFGFEVADDVAYARDTKAWQPAGNPHASLLNRTGWPWFGDEMEILVDAQPSVQGQAHPLANVVGNASQWQMCVNTCKSRLGGEGAGGLIEGEPRGDNGSAWHTYRHWIEAGVMRAATKPTGSRGNYVTEWAISYDALATNPPFDPTKGEDQMIGINLAFGDVDGQSEGDPRFGFHHEMWIAGQKNNRTHLGQFAHLWLLK